MSIIKSKNCKWRCVGLVKGPYFAWSAECYKFPFYTAFHSLLLSKHNFCPNCGKKIEQVKGE